MIIRPATIADASDMARLRAASIRLLCRADHAGDKAAIDAWVSDPDKFVRLITDHPEAVLVVAEISGIVAGLAGYHGDRVTLNYVDPDFRFAGVSTALLAAIEGRMADNGVTLGRLESTATAQAFYRARGWKDDGPASRDLGIPMRKTLLAQAIAMAR